MAVRAAVIGGMAWGCMALASVSLAQAATLKATALVRADDPRLERSQLERAYLGHPGGEISDALKLAVDETKFEVQAAGAQLAIETRPVADAAAAKAAAVSAQQAGAAALIVDLPAAWLPAVADAVRIPVLNVSAADDALRGKDCRARLLHVAPSERMRSDALAQTLVSRKWTKVLVLAGPTPADQLRLATVQASMKRYGLQAVATKPFKLSADPRERDLANLLLLTAGSAYDVVWVVDSAGEFARSLPYRTVLPRPVVGDAGLVALAWHPQYERYGAPQVSRRFMRATRRAMTASDWSAWMAGKVLATVAAAQPNGTPATWTAAITGVQVDGSKGQLMSFRAWDGQMRQPMLLTDGQGVIATAPVEGLLHPKDVLDTLGSDAPEKLCTVAR